MTAASVRYRLNGHLLNTSAVEDIVVNQDASRPMETDITDFKDSVNVEDFGYGLGRFTIEIVLRGVDQAKEARFISEEIQTSPWTLSVENGSFSGDTALFEDHKRLALAAQDVSQQPSRNFKQLKFRIRAVLLGAWSADGGVVCTKENGWFEQTAASTYLTEDGDTVSDFLITLPEQGPGYPKARNAGTEVLEELTVQSTTTEETRDGETRTLETYDLSGYLWPSDPSTDGDVGQWTVESCPSLAYLEANVNPGGTGGVASQRVAGFRVGSA